MTVQVVKNIVSELEFKNEDLVDLKLVDYDELLSSAGEFGRYQVLLFFATFPFYMSGAFVYFSQLFITEASSNHWCWIPELENLTKLERISLAIPADPNSKYGYSQCQAYVVNWTEVLLMGQKANQTWPTAPCQNGWEFDKTEIPYPTISSEMGWVCDKKSYQATAQAVFFAGSSVGGLLFGWLADRFGRIPAAVASNVAAFVGGLLSTFANNLVHFSVCRFIMGMAYDNCEMLIYLLVLECVAPKYRSILSIIAFSIFYTVFVTASPWIALACGHWKTFSFVTSFSLILAVCAPFIIPESPRWLLSKGRVDEAIEKILLIGRMNKREVPKELIEQFKHTLSKKNVKDTKTCLDIFKRPVLRRMLFIVGFVYMCCLIVFDGLIRSIGQLNFDFFVSFSVISLTELPSLFLVAFTLDWLGRRWLMAITLAVACVSSVSSAFVNSGIQSVACAVVARFAVNMAITATSLWVLELMPTAVRGSCSSLVHICGFGASISSPYIVYLNFVSHWLPLVIVGAIAGLGGVLALLLPETAKKEMPHTFDDAEELSKKHTIWEMPCLKKQEFDAHGHVNQCFDMQKSCP